MDRYRIVDIHNDEESWSEMKIHERGEFIKYADYEAEKSAMCEANSNAVLAEVLALLMEDFKTLSKNNMDHKASGVHRAVVLIKNYRRKHFI